MNARELSIINGDYWVAYFDIMGFENRVRGFEQNFGPGHLDLYVKNFFERILKKIDDALHRQNEFMSVALEQARFSDSFVFYTPVVTTDSFCTIDMLFRRFIGAAISSNFPVRGVLTVGDFYADKLNNVFLGPALAEAYKYAERQDWIGCIVCPSAAARLKEMGLSLSRRADYVLYEVPMKQIPQESTSSTRNVTKDPHFAYRLSKQPTTIERHLRHMKNESCNSNSCTHDPQITRKYDNTLKFFEKTRLGNVVD